MLVVVLAAFAPLVFLVTEAIAAIAWTAGTYNYGHNFISDLGTTVCGSTFGDRVMCSPLHGVMNFGYVAMGLGVAVTVALLALRLHGARRVWSTVLGGSLAVGMILVATFPGGVESVDNGTIVLHSLGAAIAISFGNILAILMGANAASLGFPGWYSRVAIALGVIGLVGLVLLLSGVTFLDPAVFERISVYTIFLWLFLTSGVQIAVNRDRGGSVEE
jgi:hypothetical protein